MNTCFLYLRTAKNQKILKRYTKCTCNLKSLSQVNTYFLIEGVPRTVHSYYLIFSQQNRGHWFSVL